MPSLKKIWICQRNMIATISWCLDNYWTPVTICLIFVSQKRVFTFSKYTHTLVFPIDVISIFFFWNILWSDHIKMYPVIWYSPTYILSCITKWLGETQVWLQWRHNDRDGVWSPQSHDCLLNRLFRRRLKKTSKLRVTGLCAGNSPVTD